MKFITPPRPARLKGKPLSEKGRGIARASQEAGNAPLRPFYPERVLCWCPMKKE